MEFHSSEKRERGREKVRERESEIVGAPKLVHNIMKPSSGASACERERERDRARVRERERGLSSQRWPGTFT